MSDETTTTEETFGPTPEGVFAINARIDDALADKLYAVASTSKSGVSNHKTYPDVNDAAYKTDVARLRKHLASRLADGYRVAVSPYRVPGKGVGFSLLIKTRKARAPK